MVGAACVRTVVKVEHSVTQPVLVQNADDTPTFPAVHFELLRLRCAFFRKDVAGIEWERADQGYLETNSAAMRLLLLLVEVAYIFGQREIR